MPQQTSPFLEGKFGWNYGESGWNSGMDENINKFSFMFDGNVIDVVSTLPTGTNGSAYFLTTDNRFYFNIGGTYYSCPCPKNFVFKILSSGIFYQFDGASLLIVKSPADVDAKLQEFEVTISTLGTAAYEDVDAFVTPTTLADPTMGSNLVGFKANGAGAVDRTVAQKLQDKVDLKDFGAVGDGIADDTAAIQAAINAAGGIKRICGGGTFRITSSLTYHTSGNVAGLVLDLDPGSVILADFAGNTTSFPEGEPAISLNGSGVIYSFQFRGAFHGFTITKTASATNIAGIQTVGAWEYTLDNVVIENLDGNGIYLPNRSDLAANPDAWASIKWSLNKCRIFNCLDGIQSQAGQGSAGWQLYDCYVVNNKRHGVLADASAWRYVGGAYATNGTSGVGSGIKYVKHLGVTPTNAYIDQCEIDSNWDSGFEADEFGFLEIVRGRFISKYGVYHPGHTSQQSHIKITGSIFGAKLVHNFHRMDSGLTAPITLYDIGVPSGNRKSIYVDDYNVQNDFGATVIEATSGALASRFANVVRKTGAAGAKNNDYRNFVYAAKAALGAVPSTATKWIFATTQSPTGWTSFYNSSTGDLTAPFSGEFDIRGHLTIEGLAAGARFRIQVFVGATLQDAFTFQPAAATVRQTLNFDTVVTANSGDIISVQIDATGAGTNTISQPGHLLVRAL